MIRLHEIKRSLAARKVQFYAKGKFMNERLAYREPFPYSKTEGEYAAITGMKFKALKTDEPNHTWSRLKL